MIGSIKIYGLFGFLRLIRDKLFTMLFYPKARIIRLPVYIRGKKGIQGGESLTTGVNLRIDIINSETTSPVLYIGKNVEFNDYVHMGVAEGISIGDNRLIASKVFISDHNHGSYEGEIHSHPNEKPNARVLSSKKVTIGRNVWIGECVSILPGITIGAMSLVSRDIPANSIAVGSPARVIKKFDETKSEWVSI